VHLLKSWAQVCSFTQLYVSWLPSSLCTTDPSNRIFRPVHIEFAAQETVGSRL
jgi:hypothetical protein